MNSKHNLLTAGSILLGALTVSTTTFAATPLSHGYSIAEVAMPKSMEESKCGANKAKEVQETKCGANKQQAPAPVKAKEAKCGEAKCGANKKKDG